MTRTVRRPRSVREAGPYKVHSCSDGTLTIEPAWPKFRPWTAEEGGGPGVYSRMVLAVDLQAWLNNEVGE